MKSTLRRLGSSLAALATAVTPAVAQIDHAQLEALAARSIGPAGMSGRIGAIDAVADDPNVIYVGAATGGLWRSTSGGTTWEPLMDSLPAASIGAIAIYQAAPDIVWVGTGERNRRNSAGVGTGVYKTMDGGKTWERLGLERTGAVDAIVLHPSNPDIAYVGALGNTWADSEDRGVYRTTDGGRTWSKILYVDERTGAGDLVMDPANPNKLFAAMWEHRRWPWFFESGGEGSGLHITFDGGRTWRQLTSEDGLPEGELGRIGLDFSLSNPEVVYAVVEATKSVMLRSDDGGLTWRTVNSDPVGRRGGIAVRPFYYAQVRVDPENENRLYNVQGDVDFSEDGGKTFRNLMPSRTGVHVDHHAFWINPHDGRHIIDGNDGGVSISRDRGKTWRFVENLPLAQFYHIAVDMETPYHVLGGLQDNGSWRGPASVWENGGIRYYHWAELNFGDGFATIMDPNAPRYGYAMSQGGALVRFDAETGDGVSIRPAHAGGTTLRFNWNAGIAADPFDGCIYYGSQFLHKSCDMGRSWEILSPDLTTDDPEKQRQLESGGLTYDVTDAENHTTILTIAPSPVEQGVIWVGTDDGNVQVTRDGGATWANVADRIRGVAANTWVPHIEASKHDAATAYVVFDDHRRGDDRPYLYKTTDYGRSWRSLVTPELDYFLHAVEEDPVNPAVLYLGSEFGMYLSLDGGRSWTLWRHGLPRAPVRALVVHPRDHDLVIGTHGRAAYVIDDVRPVRALAAEPSIVEEALHLFEVPPAIQYEIAQVRGMRFVGDAKFIGGNRPYGALLTYYLREAPDTSAPGRPAAAASSRWPGAGAWSGGRGGRSGPTATIEILDADGEIIRAMEGPAARGLNRTAWDLRHDRFRSLQQESAWWGGSGPYVLPGTYTVRVTVGDAVSERAVEVIADPRLDVSLEDRRANLELQMRIGQRRSVTVEGVERLRKAKDGIDAVLDALSAKHDSASSALKQDGASLKDRLEEIELQVTERDDKQGIWQDPTAVWNMITSAGRAVPTWERPPESAHLYLEQAEARLTAVLESLNAVLSTDVAQFRERVSAVGIELVPPLETLTIDWEEED